METITIAYITLTIAIGFAYINHRFVKMQTTIALMTASLLIAMGLIVFGQLGFGLIERHIHDIVSQIDFHGLLMHGMLSFLLFAGALHIDLNHLLDHKWEIGVLATVGTIISTGIIAGLAYYLLHFLGVNIPFIYCLLFGALISPTDPIAVLATFKKLNAPKKLDAKVAGESLFNDGVGIVMFLSLYEIAFSGTDFTWAGVTQLFAQQAFGGVIYGIALGVLAYKLIESIDDHKIEILITLAITTGGYSLAEQLNISGPLAMVVAGIFIGNKGRKFSMGKKSREALDMFWELIDEILNAVLFLLIGFELLLVEANKVEIVAALLAIPMVLSVRALTIGIPFSLFKLRKKYLPYTARIMVWGGLRGGLAVALALALPANEYRNLILAMTYAVVAFAVIVQGSTVKILIERMNEKIARDELQK